jgi:hypothetical protein
VAVVALALAAPPAPAVPRTAQEVAALAGRAQGDPGALRDLRRTTRVDGRPAALARALDAATPEDLAQRLRALAASASAGSAGGAAAGGGIPAADPEAARAHARRILASGPFAAGTPRKTLGQRIGDWLQARVDDLDELLPGGTAVTWAALGVLVLLAFAVGTARSFQRLQTAAGAADGPGRGARPDPAELERRAAQAERDGRFDDAVRLRFAAGLLRLDAARAIELRPSLTSGQVARAVGSPRLAELTHTFDEVAYGHRPARAGDAEAARTGWPEVLEEARR